jgi:hypothetical protein
MTCLQELERRVAEANARVAEAATAYVGKDLRPTFVPDHCGAPYRDLHAALRARQAALTALEEARRPRLMTAGEAVTVSGFYPSAATFTGLDLILDAAHERVLKVIEGLPSLGDGTLECRKIEDIRTALRSGRNVVAQDAKEGVQHREGSKS